MTPEEADIKFDNAEPIPISDDEINHMVSVAILSADNRRLKDAGAKMAAAAIRVCTEYDGTHRLMQAVSEWAAVVATEHGRGPAIPQRATPATVAQIEAQGKQVRRETERCNSDQSCIDTDGAPTEMAVLKRFWIEHHNKGK